MLEATLRRRPLPAGAVAALGPVWQPTWSRLRFDWSPDGERIAVASAGGTVTIWDVHGEQVAARVEGKGGSRTEGTVSWSSDGCGLAQVLLEPGAAGRIVVWRQGTAGGWRIASTLGPVTGEQLAWWPFRGLLVSRFFDQLAAWDVETACLLRWAVEFRR